MALKMSIFGIEISGKKIHWAIFEAAEKNKATFKFAEVKIVCLVFKNFNSKSHQQKKNLFQNFYNPLQNAAARDV